MDLSGRGAASTEDAQGTPTQSHISPSILVYANKGHLPEKRLKPRPESGVFMPSSLDSGLGGTRGATVVDYHGVVSPEPREGISGDTTPCRMTGVTLHGVVSPDCQEVNTLSGR